MTITAENPAPLTAGKPPQATVDTGTRIDFLDRLAGELDRKYAIRAWVTAPPGRTPALCAFAGPGREQDVYADAADGTWWYWWPWAERIAPVRDPGRAAAAIAGELASGAGTGALYGE